MKKKLALLFLLLGIGCLAGYILLLFSSGSAFSIMATLVLSIAFNVTAVNLLMASRPAREEEDDG